MTYQCETPTGSLAGVSWKSLAGASTDLITPTPFNHQDVIAACKRAFHSAPASTALEHGGHRYDV
jgi:hypothetical protein